MGYKYEIQEVPVIAGFECDCCGQEFDGTELMDCAVIDRTFGYNSGHDREGVDAVLCETCYYRMLKDALPDECFKPAEPEG